MTATWRCAGLWAVVLAGPVLAAAGPQPKIQVDEPVYKFGKVWDFEPVEREFEVKNAGDAPLRIKRVRSTCGCLPVKAKPQTLAPGASTKIKIRLVAKNLRGKLKKAVYVESNDPKKPRQPLTFSGEVRQSITMAPPAARFKQLDHKVPSTLELTLTNHLPDPMTLSGPVSTHANVSVECSEIEKGKTFKVLLTAKPPYTGRALSGKVTFKTGLAKPLTHTISFFARVPPPVNIEPVRVFDLGRLDNSKEYTRTVRLVSTGGEPFELMEVSSSNWRFMPLVRELTEKKVYDVQITARPPFVWGANRAYVTFKTRPAVTTKLAVQLHGQLPPPITVSPQSLLFRHLTPEKGGQASVTISVDAPEPVKISSARSTLKNVTPKLETLEEGKRYRLTGTATPPLGPGRLSGQITLDTSHPKMKTLTVPVQSFPIRRPLPAVSVTPDPVLTIPGAGATTRPANASFVVRANNNEKVHVTKVEVSHDQIATSVEPYQGAKDRMTFVRITVPATARLRPEGETITIHTDHKRFGKFTRQIARYKRPTMRVRRPIRPGPPKAPPATSTQRGAKR